jgi:hypothetical protein
MAMPHEGPSDRDAVGTFLKTILAAVSLLAAAVGVQAAFGQSAPAPSAAPPPRLAAIAPGGQIRALVMGIDSYKHPEHALPLTGAVADARDLEATLTRAGAADLTVLIDSAATRAAVRTALGGIAQRTKADDLVVVTFAGHGYQRAEEVKGSEPDGLDEYFVMWGFDGETGDELILDDEMRSWLGEITRTGAQVLFLADSCHGGGMTKAPDPRATLLPVRSIKPKPGAGPIKRRGAALAVQRRGASVAGSDLATGELPTLSFIAAVDDKTEAPEIRVAGVPTPRGAASYAFARALEGLADAEGNRDGHTTRGELFQFMRRQVRQLSRDTQFPIAEPRRREAADVALFRSGDGTASAAVVPSVPAAPAGKSAGAAPSPSAAVGALIQHAATGDIIDPSGMVVAFKQPPGSLPLAYARLSAYQRLVGLARGRGLEVRIAPEGRHLRIGEAFSMTAEGLYGHFVVIVNLAGDGTVQLLYPTGRVVPFAEQDRVVNQMRAEEPPGADTLIVLATTERRTELELALALMNGRKQPTELTEAVAKHLGREDRLGLATYTTLPRR